MSRRGEGGKRKKEKERKGGGGIAKREYQQRPLPKCYLTLATNESASGPVLSEQRLHS